MGVYTRQRGTDVRIGRTRNTTTPKYEPTNTIHTRSKTLMP